MFMRKAWSILVGLLVLLFLLPPAAQAATPRQAEILIDQIEANAIDVRNHAARIRTYTRVPGQYSWQLHASEWVHAKTGVEEIGRLIDRYNSGVRSNALKGQNEAVNFIVPRAVKLSDAVEKAIKIVGDDKRKLEVAHPGYETTVDEVYSLADQIVAACDLAEKRAEVEKAMAQLGLKKE